MAGWARLCYLLNIAAGWVSCYLQKIPAGWASCYLLKIAAGWTSCYLLNIAAGWVSCYLLKIAAGWASCYLLKITENILFLLQETHLTFCIQLLFDKLHWNKNKRKQTNITPNSHVHRSLKCLEIQLHPCK